MMAFSIAYMLIGFILTLDQSVHGFTALSRYDSILLSGSGTQDTARFASTVDNSNVATTTTSDTTTEKGRLKRDRYVATNRFAVRKGQQAKFEKRWATRKSRLATLPGFRYFHLMRRVQLRQGGGGGDTTTTLYDEGDTDENAFENYVSFTIWDKKSDFSAWRSGEAFKEAHGGTSITAFLSTMVNSAMVLRGAPRPAFYDGLHILATQKPRMIPETVDGWRNIVHDFSVSTLPAESFIELIKYYVQPGSDSIEFEKSWNNRDTNLDQADGFVCRSLLRRDGQAKGHGIVPMDSTEPSFVGVTIFRDRSSYETWSKSPSGISKNPSQQKSSKTLYYEGTLVISSQDGP